MNLKTFNGEVAIHFRGLEGLSKPIVWVFPELAICADCGLTQYVVPHRELRVLVEGRSVDGAVILDEAPRGNNADAA